MFPEIPLKVDLSKPGKKNYWLLIWLENYQQADGESIYPSGDQVLR
jgi:hypothetical protein